MRKQRKRTLSDIDEDIEFIRSEMTSAIDRPSEYLALAGELNELIAERDKRSKKL